VTFEESYAAALLAPDPVRALRALARDPALPAETRRRLRAADPDGVRLSALLVARLRFERLLRGSSAAERWYDEDASAFTDAFRRYHHAVPPTAFFPKDEAALWERFLARAR
jgi:hypothetical protein